MNQALLANAALSRYRVLQKIGAGGSGDLNRGS
jgi:hypothetical protein